MKLIRIGAFLGLGLALAGTGALLVTPQALMARGETTPEVKAMHFAPYEAQKVIYHVMDGEGLLERRFKNILHVARNHLDAVLPGDLDLRIMMQGGGVDLLKKARTDAHLASSIDRLKRDGVRFVVCRNTLVQRGINPADLHGVAREDIVASTMAETARLIAAGHIYLKF